MTLGRDGKIWTALRTNQIAGFVTEARLEPIRLQDTLLKIKTKGIFPTHAKKIGIHCITALFNLFIHRLRQNFELLKHRRQDAKGTLITLEKEIANMTEKTRVLNKRMNSIKPEIIKLQRSKQQYYL